MGVASSLHYHVAPYGWILVAAVVWLLCGLSLLGYALALGAAGHGPSPETLVGPFRWVPFDSHTG